MLKFVKLITLFTLTLFGNENKSFSVSQNSKNKFYSKYDDLAKVKKSRMTIARVKKNYFHKRVFTRSFIYLFYIN